jgi:hypothetical protein
MSARLRLVLLVALVLGGCAAEEKQWLKVNERYTTAEFRRDYAACSKDGTLDEACLRAKGWVDVKPSPGDRAAQPVHPTNENYRYGR